MGESVTHNGDGAFFEARVFDQHPAKIVPYSFKAFKSRISEQFSPFVQHRARNDCVVIERSEWGVSEWVKNLHLSALLSSKWPKTMESDIVNYQNSKAIPCNICIQFDTVCSFMFACKPWNACDISWSWQLFGLQGAVWFQLLPFLPCMPNWKDSRCSTLSPKGFPLVLVCAVMSTASSLHEARTGYQVLQILLNELVCT